MEELHELILGLLPRYSAKNGMTVKEIVARLTTSDGQMDLGLMPDNASPEQPALFSFTEKDIAKSLSLLFKNQKISKKKGKNGAWAYKLHKPMTPVPGTGVIPGDTENTSYRGKGGEFAVMAELLYKGYNANPMTVDEGIDVVASKKQYLLLYTG